MYFPYLRGKQFELIALREISNFLSENSAKISPIIEPVKDSSTLKSTLKELAEKNINFNFILNPRVGSLKDASGRLIEIISEILEGYNNFQIGIIIERINQQNLARTIEVLSELEFEHNGFTLIHTSELDNATIEQLSSGLDIKYNLIYFSKTSRRYYRAFSQETRVSLDDYFKKLDRNADYLALEESDFSEEYLFYGDEGFVGFSDFLTIGDNYSETGFLPRAVAIHLSYIDNNRIKIRHFTSDSNQDSSDIAGKFAEALEKLVEWCDQRDLQTRGVNIFRELYAQGHFPGLGSVKKISTINHIELVINNI